MSHAFFACGSAARFFILGDVEFMDMWLNYRKNILFLRKHFKITQGDLSCAIGISRGSYQHFEVKGTGGPFPAVTMFWLKNYGLTPNDLLLHELTEEDLIHRRKIVKIKVKKKEC